MRYAAVRRARFRCALLALPVALAVVTSCGTDPAAPDAVSTPPSLGRGGEPGPIGDITLTLILNPEGPQDFGFTLTSSSGTKITAGKGKVTLDDDADPTLPNTRDWPSLGAGTYVLTMNPLPAGYVLLDVSCITDVNSSAQPSQANRQAILTLATGGHPACTFTVVTP